MQNLGLGDEGQKQRQLGAEVEGQTGGRNQRGGLAGVAVASWRGSLRDPWAGAAGRGGWAGDPSLRSDLGTVGGTTPSGTVESSRGLEAPGASGGPGDRKGAAPRAPTPAGARARGARRSARFPAAGAAGPGKHCAKSPARSIPSGGGFLVPVVSTPGGGAGGVRCDCPSFWLVFSWLRAGGAGDDCALSFNPCY